MSPPGFGVFLIERFFWLRKAATLKASYRALISQNATRESTG